MSKTFKELQQQAHRTAMAKGWWVKPRTFLECMALVHCEVSEASECYRDGHRMDKVWLEGLKPCGIASELADIIIRVLDTAQAYQIPLEETLEQKMNYNETRPYRHGNKVA
jgi:NTP pyrophosphatase (non-canonical NTP hydrolase)